MSSFAVTAERLIVHPHPDPAVERIELAQVGEYRAVVPKGQYTTGDWALYIPEQAIVPEELLQELGLAGKLAGEQAELRPRALQNPRIQRRARPRRGGPSHREYHRPRTAEYS